MTSNVRETIGRADAARRGEGASSFRFRSPTSPEEQDLGKRAYWANRPVTSTRSGLRGSMIASCLGK